MADGDTALGWVRSRKTQEFVDGQWRTMPRDMTTSGGAAVLVPTEQFATTFERELGQPLAGG